MAGTFRYTVGASYDPLNSGELLNAGIQISTTISLPSRIL